MSFLSKNDPTEGELIKGIDLDDDPEPEEAESEVEAEAEVEADEEAEPAPATTGANPYDELFNRSKRRARSGREAGR